MTQIFQSVSIDSGSLLFQLELINKSLKKSLKRIKTKNYEKCQLTSDVSLTTGQQIAQKKSASAVVNSELLPQKFVIKLSKKNIAKQPMSAKEYWDGHPSNY